MHQPKSLELRDLKFWGKIENNGGTGRLFCNLSKSFLSSLGLPVKLAICPTRQTRLPLQVSFKESSVGILSIEAHVLRDNAWNSKNSDTGYSSTAIHCDLSMEGHR